MYVYVCMYVALCEHVHALPIAMLHFACMLIWSSYVERTSEMPPAQTGFFTFYHSRGGSSSAWCRPPAFVVAGYVSLVSQEGINRASV